MASTCIVGKLCLISVNGFANGYSRPLLIFYTYFCLRGIELGIIKSDFERMRAIFVLNLEFQGE